MLRNLSVDRARSLQNSSATDRLETEKADKKWSFGTDMSSPPRGDWRHRINAASRVTRLAANSICID